MGSDYIPRPDAEFNGWLALDTPRFAPRNPLLCNVVRITMRRVKGMTPVSTAQTTWNTNYPAHTAAQTAARSARQRVASGVSAGRNDGGRGGLEGACATAVSAVSSSGAPRDQSKALLTEQWHTANVEGAEVNVDGVFVGNAPANLKLKEGIHIIEVKKDGYQPFRRELRVLANSEVALRATLEK